MVTPLAERPRVPELERFVGEVHLNRDSALRGVPGRVGWSVLGQH